MGRVNKMTEGVFVQIVGNSNQIPDYDRFLNLQKELNEPSKELKKVLTTYTKLVNKNKATFEKMALLEELIMQIRTRDNFTFEDLRLNILREYIYARIPFFRTDKDMKDIRVIAGLTTNYGADVQNLSGNDEFKGKATEKITQAMDKIISENLNLIK